MNKTAHSLKPFLPVFIFVLIIIGIYVVGQGAFFKDSKDLQGTGQRPVLSEAERKEVGFIAPDFVMKDVYGIEAPLSLLYEKRPTLLIFWSTWCPYCAQELPDLIKFANTYQNSIYIVLVISGESEQMVKNYISEKNITFFTSLDLTRAVWQLYNVKGTPHHFLINSEGEIIAAQSGMLSLAGLERIIGKL